MNWLPPAFRENTLRPLQQSWQNNHRKTWADRRPGRRALSVSTMSDLLHLNPERPPGVLIVESDPRSGRKFVRVQGGCLLV
jgi:hypothetical protein